MKTKHIVMICGSAVALLTLCAVIVTAIIMVAQKFVALDTESKQYANTAVKAIVTNWDQNELNRLESPEFKSVTKAGDMDKLFAMFRRLGKLKECKECKGQATSSWITGKGREISAIYICRAEFEKGEAEIKISLVKHGDNWQIAGFRINSQAFLEQP
jgi:hypothetical protein